MHKLTLYPDKPFICLMKSGMAYYLDHTQYEAVAMAWGERSVMEITQYYDPAQKKSRVLKIDGFHIETVDEAEYVQEQHWLKQGGFICRWRTFHDRNDFCDCQPKDNFSTQRDSGLGSAMGENQWNKISREIAQSDVNRMRNNFEERRPEITEKFDEVETALRVEGYHKVMNRSSDFIWETSLGTKMHMLNIFIVNHHERFHDVVVKSFHEHGEPGQVYEWFCRACEFKNQKAIHHERVGELEKEMVS